jgi:hypothetical protein
MQSLTTDPSLFKIYKQAKTNHTKPRQSQSFMTFVKIINAPFYGLQPRCTVFEKSELLKKSTSAYKQINYILNYKKPDF